MPTVGVSIMAHTKRAEMAMTLATSFISATVVWDTDNTEWHTGRRAWLAHYSHYTHWLVLQDDAVICDDLIPGIELALEYVPPRSPLNLYFGRVRPYAEEITRAVQLADSISASFIVTNKLNWGVGVVVPTKLIASMIDYSDRRGDPRYDTRLSKFFEAKHIPVFNTHPSLIDHRNDPSLLGNKRENRVAHRFIGSEGLSALDLDYSGPVVRVKSGRKP